jgi:putative two-component system response regulator
VPILMVTAAHEKEVRYQSLTAGANDFLTKPIDRHEFDPACAPCWPCAAATPACAPGTTTCEAVIRKTADIVARERETIARLARAAEFRDPETGAHILRMAHYSQLIARAWASTGTVRAHPERRPMHDIGKVGTPDHILLKPGRLTDEEMEIMRRHATIGYDILKGSSSPMIQMAAEIALSHHEKFDGSGYPDGLAGEAIPLSGGSSRWPMSSTPSPRRDPTSRLGARPGGSVPEGERGQHFDPVRGCLFRPMVGVLAIRERFKDDEE